MLKGILVDNYQSMMEGIQMVGRHRMKLLKHNRFDPVIPVILVLAAFLNVYNIWDKNYVNPYYTSAVLSMLQNGHNFFFASFDPAGFVTIDKPPLAFWLQTLCAALFGLHGWSVILPQALAGVGSVLLLYALVRPSFGITAARLASLAAACMPAAVAVSRTNNVDSLLVFTLLAATWMLFKAVRTGRGLWVAAAAAAVGLAFNIKMLEAYMVLPAFFLLYWLAFKAPFKKKLGLFIAATAILICLSFAWVAAVDSVPPENRPYVGSSQTNSELDVVLGYNGLSRLTGMTGSGQAGSGLFNTGKAGPLRLFQSFLASQISWLLPLALVGSVGILAERKKRRPLTDQQIAGLFWLAWLLPMMAFFSAAGYFHSYYLTMLGPAIGALLGAGWVKLSDAYEARTGWKKWLLPLGLFGTALFQARLLGLYEAQIGSLWPLLLGGTETGVFILLCLPFKWQKGKSAARRTALIGLFGLLLAPLYWSVTPGLFGGNDIMPEAGPQLKAVNLAVSKFGITDESTDDRLLGYVTENNSGEKYLFAMTDTALTAAPYIIKSGRAVMAMGGFSGQDPVLTVEKLKQLIENKEVKFFLVSTADSPGANAGVTAWIRQYGKEIPREKWQSAESDKRGEISSSAVLYEINP